MRIYFEDDEKAFLNLCRTIGKVLEENEKFKKI
jgi:hypothetical protein